MSTKTPNNIKTTCIFFNMYYLIYFFKILWDYIFQIHFQKETKAIKNVITDEYTSLSKKYTETQKQGFLEAIKTQSTYNENINAIFYDKEDYKEIFREENNEIEKIWRTRILFETTPRSNNIIFHYNPYKMAFSYYCDQSVAYDILNAIAMKYVKIFRCVDFFMDEIVFHQQYTSPFIQIHMKEEPKEKKNIPDVKNGPFIKSKPKQSNNKNSREGDKLKKQVLNRNCFQYLGKISNFHFLQQSHRTNKNNNKQLNGFRSPLIENLTYKDYKRLLSTT